MKENKFRFTDHDIELNMSEENIEEMLKVTLLESNINIYGKEAGEYMEFVCRTFADEYNISDKAQRDLSDYCSDIASMASTYSFYKGFKEGIRLFRTLMSL